MSVTVIPRFTPRRSGPAHLPRGGRNRPSRTTLLLLGATVVAIALRLVAGLGQTGPTVPDEFGYVGQARWLAGGEPMAMGPMPYYHVGYALLLVPAAWLSGDDPVLFWRLILATNALIGAALVPLLFVLLRGLFRVPGTVAVAAAFLTSCYPSYLLVAGQGWSEIAIPTVFVLWLVTLQRLLRHPTYPTALLAGVCALSVWAVHARGLPALVITPLVLGVAVRQGRLSARFAATAVAALVVLGLGVLELQRVAFETLWWPGPGVLAESVEGLLSPGAVVELLAMLAGQLWNLLVATVGIVFLGVLALASLASSGTTSTRGEFAARATAWAALLAMAGAWAMSSAFFVGATRADQFVYGRYVEGVLPAALAAGLVVLLRARTSRSLARPLAMAGLLLVGCALVVRLVRGSGLETELWFPFNASGILLFGLDASRVQLETASVLAVAAGAAVLLAATRRRAVAAGLVLTTFLAGAVFVGSGVYRSVDDFWYRDWTPPPVPRDAGHVLMTDEPRFYFEHLAYQFWTPHATFELVPLPLGRIPDARYVFAPLGWRQWDPDTRLMWENNLDSIGLYEVPR
jgi:hypothetical protein